MNTYSVDQRERGVLLPEPLKDFEGRVRSTTPVLDYIGKGYQGSNYTGLK